MVVKDFVNPITKRIIRPRSRRAWWPPAWDQRKLTNERTYDRLMGRQVAFRR